MMLCIGLGLTGRWGNFRNLLIVDLVRNLLLFKIWNLRTMVFPNIRFLWISWERSILFLELISLKRHTWTKCVLCPISDGNISHLQRNNSGSCLLLQSLPTFRQVTSHTSRSSRRWLSTRTTRGRSRLRCRSIQLRCSFGSWRTSISILLRWRARSITRLVIILLTKTRW